MPVRAFPLSRRPLATAVVAVLASVTAAASAQEAAPASAQELDAIIVTAQKRSERIQDVPMSIAVIDAAKLASQGQVQLTDYYAQVPGLSMNARGSGRTQIVMRGIATATEQNPTVGVVIDDVPFGSSTIDIQTPDLDPSELQHIEALRGPQGTLYGASSMGGLLKYVTVDPDTSEFSARAQFDLSNVAHGGTGYGMRAAMNLPAGENFALRVSGFDRRDAGYVDDLQQGKKDINEARTHGARVSALWNASDAVTVKASVLAQDSQSNGTGTVDVDFDHNPAVREYARTRLGHTDIYDGKVRLYNLKVAADMGWATFDSISAYGEYSHDGPQDVSTTFGGLLGMIFGIPRPGVVIDNRSATDKRSQEFRLSSKDAEKLDWQVGLYYTKEETEGYQALRAVDRVSGADLGIIPAYTALSPSTFEEKAIYGDIDYHFTPKFDLQLGGRFSDVSLSSYTDYDGPMNGGEPSTEVDPDAGEKVFTFLVSPRYKLGDNSMLYGRVASGYRAGGQNGAMPGTQLPETYDSDKLVSYEVGYKGAFAGNTLSFDAALFYIDWTDIQLSIVDQATTQTYYTNGGKASSKGIETSVQWRPADGWTLGLSAAFTDASLEQNLPNGTYGLKGDRLPYSPKFSSALNVNKDFPLGSLYGFVGGGVTYVGEREAGFSTSSTVRRYDMPAYTTVDLRAGIEADAWTLTVYLKNAGDEYGFLSGTARNATTGQSLYASNLIQPRTLGASFAVRF
ncbi:MAG: TonB-dependent receptor [Pseudoxanthomonas sp.]